MTFLLGTQWNISRGRLTSHWTEQLFSDFTLLCHQNKSSSFHGQCDFKLADCCKPLCSWSEVGELYKSTRRQLISRFKWCSVDAVFTLLSIRGDNSSSLCNETTAITVALHLSRLVINSHHVDGGNRFSKVSLQINFFFTTFKKTTWSKVVHQIQH